MRIGSVVAAALVGVFAVSSSGTWTAKAANAKPSAADHMANPIVARAGSLTMTEKQIEARLARMVAFQLKTFGQTPEAIREGYLERVVVPELVFTAEARALGIPQRPDVAFRADRILATALKNHLRHEADTRLTASEIREYFDSAHGPGEVFEQEKSSYRITLRRRKADAELARIKSQAKSRVTRVQPELVEQLRLTPAGEVRWAGQASDVSRAGAGATPP